MAQSKQKKKQMIEVHKKKTTFQDKVDACKKNVTPRDPNQTKEEACRRIIGSQVIKERKKNK